jgi:hypothetical protein
MGLVAVSHNKVYELPLHRWPGSTVKARSRRAYLICRLAAAVDIHDWHPPLRHSGHRWARTDADTSIACKTS